ncbi:MAG TPA: SDR family NAD(P)-dependent oxidoreductase [Steroidobacteraceae bacterium]|jgi:NAD(P)-dependent dehydrogenase (short-subunit alcohol dehydrogenase family)|nr:SDR family NAD(P)-dependent oxidoreductase [Steroidobacteraceae bacterium]
MKDSPQKPTDILHTLDRFAAERRRFLAEGSVYGAGILASLGLSQYVRAQGGPPAPGSGPAGFVRPPPPPEPAFSQRAPLHDLKGKVAYITASSDGIGLGIARAASAAGMKVCIGYRNEDRLKAALPLFKAGNAGVLPIKHDVTDRDGWAKALQTINSQFGNLHLVVNNAGLKTGARASMVSAKDWDDAVAVNYTATYNSVAVCLPHMLQHGEGSQIVVTSSMSGLLPGGPLGVYTATKIAAVGLIEALRVELEGTTVGTSAFCPGGVNTDNYQDTGQTNPYRAEQAAARARAAAARPAGSSAPPPRRPFNGPPPGMDPIEAGERVLNGVIHNDLFIITHPEYMPGTQQRFDAMLDSEPKGEAPVNPDRVRGETRVLTCGIYRRESAHRKEKRKSFRSVTLDT